jgi:hypothetical protein
MNFLSNGLRKSLLGPCKSLFSLLLSKFKDKKLINETHPCLKNILTHCLGLEEVQEDLSEALNDKNQVLKVQVVILLEKLFENTSLS